MVFNWEVRLFRLLNRFLFSEQKPCLLLVPPEWEWHVYLYCTLGQTNLISGSTGFFSKFEGSVGREKRKIKKNPQYFALALIINKNFL